jgi:hypothetical protein
MNKIQQILKYALMIGTMAAFTAACSDDDPEPSGKLLPSIIWYDNNGVTTVFTFTYDKKNRITKIVQQRAIGKHTCTINYSSDNKPKSIKYENGDGYTDYILSYEGDVVNVGSSKLTLIDDLLYNYEIPFWVSQFFNYDTHKNLYCYYYDSATPLKTYCYYNSQKGIFSNTATPIWVRILLGNFEVSTGLEKAFYSPDLITSRTVESGSYIENYTYTWSGDQNGFPEKAEVKRIAYNGVISYSTYIITYTSAK